MIASPNILVLDCDTKIRLSALTKPLNADLDAMGASVEGLWSGSSEMRNSKIVEQTSWVEHIENLAALVPGRTSDTSRASWPCSR